MPPLAPLAPLVQLDCPRCRQPQPRGTARCPHCGVKLAAKPRPKSTPRTSAAREAWLYLGLGLCTAPLFAVTPLVQYMGWFLASLVHELGHTLAAWICGMPAFPAISLEGHAAAVHSQQLLFVALIVLALALYGVWHFLDGRVRWIAGAIVVIVHGLLVFTLLKDVLHLVAGHAGELAFATLCLFKALDGGFTSSRVERGLYGTVGWFLVGRNLWLTWGLLTSRSARALYHANAPGLAVG